MATPAPALAALLSAIGPALQRRDLTAARRLVAEAEALDPTLAEVQLNKALVCRIDGDTAGALAAFDQVLARDPKHFIALLSKASLIETASGPRQAARAYRAALALAPPPDRLPPELARAVAHGQGVIEADTRALHAHLRKATEALRRTTDTDLERFDESLDAFAGVARVPVQRPLLLHYSRLPSIPFYDRALFPWLPELEAATDIIADELRGLMQAAPDDFVPYIQFPPGVPVNQWGELNHSRLWSSCFLWQDGVRHAEPCRLCPRTAALIDRLPLMHQPGFAPTAVFSALQPHTHIPPHTGSANTRLLCHLPLILPGPARFRVGTQTREWRMGEAWVFDDTIEHEAWNDADQTRVILILDLWNPLIPVAERELIGAMMAARNEYYAAG